MTSNLLGSITVTPQGGDYRLGGFLLHMPSGAICDPRTTSYGPDFWDQACAPLSVPITLTVQVTAREGRMWIDFKPNVRFAPSTDPSQWVTLTTWRKQGELQSAYRSGRLRQYALLYAPEIGAPPVDEGRKDRSMITVIRLDDGTISRRLKHFSGFTISLGKACDESDPTCTAPTGGEVDVQTSSATQPVPTIQP